jgi:hypothetical protein
MIARAFMLMSHAAVHAPIDHDNVSSAVRTAPRAATTHTPAATDRQSDSFIDTVVSNLL